MPGSNKVGPTDADRAEPHRRSQRRISICIALLIGCVIGLAIALAFVLTIFKANDGDVRGPCGAASSESSASTAAAFPPRVADVFDPFTQAELDQIAAHVRTNLGLMDEEPANLTGNWLYAIDFLPRTKTDALAHIDDSAAFTGRQAKAIVYRMADASPAVVEYRVGPIASFPIVSGTVPVVALNQHGTLGAVSNIPHKMRPVSPMEYEAMEPLVVAAMTELANLSMVSYGELYDAGNMFWTDTAPRGYDRATRQTWIWFVWYMEGMFALPLGVQMLIDHSSLDAATWTIMEIEYNGQGPFNSAAELAAAFDSGSLDAYINYTRPVITDWENSPLWSSMRRRGPTRPLETLPTPTVVPQGGKRYSVQGNQVQWLDWDLHVGYSTVIGVSLNDIRFRAQRIVYELSLQDAYAAYSGNTLLQSLSQYSDGGWGMGKSNFKLMLGVDCPIFATLLPTSFFADGESCTNEGSICIWEQPEDVAVMRHYDQNFFEGGFNFAASYHRSILVVRTSSTVRHPVRVASACVYARVCVSRDGRVHVCAGFHWIG